MTHKKRLELIHRGLPPVRIIHPQKRWAGVFVNDYFGENLDARKRDQGSVYEGAYTGVVTREILALDGVENPLLDRDLMKLSALEDSTEVRQFIESQTRSHRKAHSIWS